MAKSSIKFARTQDNSVAETTREFEAHYLLEKKYRLKNEYWNCGKTDSQVFQEELAKTKRKGGPKPKEENSLWEAILNLNHEHTMADVQRAVKLVEKKFNIICTRVAIHRDEGHLDKEGKVVYNLHAHLNFVTFKNGRQNWRQKFIRPMMSDLQTEIAKELKMERGRFKDETGVVAMGHREYRAHAKTVEKIQEKVAQKEKELVTEKEKSAYSFRDFQAQITALGTENTDLKKELHRLNTSVKKGETDVEELQKRLEEERKKLEAKERELVSAKSSVETYKKLYESTDKLAETYKKRYEAEKAKAPVTEKEDTKRIEELQNALKTLKNELESTNGTLSSVQSALNAQNSNMTTLALSIESSTEYKLEPEEEHFNFIVRVVSSLFEKIQSLSKQISSLLLSETKKEAPKQEQMQEKEQVSEKESTANAYAELQKQLDKQIDVKDLTSFNEEHKNRDGYTR